LLYILRLQQLYFVANAHESFVTALSFLPQKIRLPLLSVDENGSANQQQQAKLGPGLCAVNAQAAVVSLSVDQTLQLHKVSRLFQPLKTIFKIKLI
jgi:hypothetical protein